MLFPARIREGDTVGIVSPSSPIAAFCPRRLKRGMEELEKRGFRVKAGKHVSARTGHTAGTAAQRLEDLHAMFADDEVKAIICTIGGYNANMLLEGLDFDLIRSHPKILMGYSDITVLLNAIHARTGLVTYLGPAVLPQFGEFGGTMPYTWDALKSVLMSDAPMHVVASKEWTDEMTFWDKEDDRPRAMKQNIGIKVLREGRAEGTIIGGNLGTLLLLTGTPMMPDLSGAILCIEEDEVESPATVERMLTHLRQTGALAKINGMLIGRFHGKVAFSDADPLADVLLRAMEGFDFPVMYDLDFGHTDPLLTVPIGGHCAMDTAKKDIVFSSFIA